MANTNELLKKGIIISVTTESINNRTAFPDSKAKSYYLKLLMEGLKINPQIKILAYAVLKDSAYVLGYADNDNRLNNMMIQVNESYSNYYNERYDYNGYVFRLPNQSCVIKNEGIIPAICHIHKLPEYKNISRNYRKYKFSSCYPIFKHMNKIVQTPFLLRLLDIDKLDGVTYTSWHRQGMYSKMPQERKGVEKFNKAMDACVLRYKGTSAFTNEDALKQIIMDVNERCLTPYRKIAKKMGLENRRDILIEIIASMVFDRGFTYLDAVNQLQVQEYGVYTLLMEVIITVNERTRYGYDFIINKLEVDDSNYDILVEAIKLLYQNYGIGFVETAKKFNLQNNIIDVRMRAGI